MKVHVTLDLTVATDADSRWSLADEVINTSKMQAVNRKRVGRYGVVTGEVSPDAMEAIARIPGVKNCEEDSEKQLLKTPSVKLNPG